MSTRRALALDRPITRPLGLDITAAAAGIIRVATANMVLGIHVVSVERGRDRRCQTLVPGGMYGSLLAYDLRPRSPKPDGLNGRRSHRGPRSPDRNRGGIHDRERPQLTKPVPGARRPYMRDTTLVLDP